MIDLALGVIATQLNLALKRSFDGLEDVVVLSNLLEQDGSLATQADNKLVVTLVNIERDTMPQRPAQSASAGARLPVTAAPVYLRLSVLISANFASGNYNEALKFISAAIGFFQSRPVLDHSNTPDLDPRLDRLVMDIANLSLTELSNLWSTLSGKYLPSVLYRVRMVSVDMAQLTRQDHPIVALRRAVNP